MSTPRDRNRRCEPPLARLEHQRSSRGGASTCPGGGSLRGAEARGGDPRARWRPGWGAGSGAKIRPNPSLNVRRSRTVMRLRAATRLLDPLSGSIGPVEPLPARGVLRLGQPGADRVIGWMVVFTTSDSALAAMSIFVMDAMRKDRVLPSSACRSNASAPRPHVRRCLSTLRLR